MATTIEDVRRRLREFDQEHVLQFWDGASDADRDRLLRELDAIDLAQLARLYRAGSSPPQKEDAARRAERALPPSRIVRVPTTDAQRADWAAARKLGGEFLQSGRAAAILVAGGQGTRLGFDQPKGLYPIGPVSERTLFQILAEKLLAAGRRHGVRIPLAIMTSDATHTETVACFEAQNYFGLDPAAVLFFRQGTMPAVDASTGRLLLSGKGQLALSPDGHGGLMTALRASGVLERLRRAGVEQVYYHQVDNPAACVCDAAFFGWHLQHRSELSTKVVRKRSPEERMGVPVEVDGRLEIIEYSDLPAEVARKKDPDGQSLHWAGSTAIHIFSIDLLERLSDGNSGLPFHIAKKAVPYVDEKGQTFKSREPNAFKFERFIFDALPLAGQPLIVETERDEEFLPLKNRDADASDCPSSVREGLRTLYINWLREAGQNVPANARVEISPLFADSTADLLEKVRQGFAYKGQSLLDATALPTL